MESPGVSHQWQGSSIAGSTPANVEVGLISLSIESSLFRQQDRLPSTLEPSRRLRAPTELYVELQTLKDLQSGTRILDNSGDGPVRKPGPHLILLTVSDLPKSSFRRYLPLDFRLKPRVVREFELWFLHFQVVVVPL